MIKSMLDMMYAQRTDNVSWDQQITNDKPLTQSYTKSI